jgi:hypothetical protein
MVSPEPCRRSPLPLDLRSEVPYTKESTKIYSTEGGSMSHTEFVHLLKSINALFPEQMRQLACELETRLAGAEHPPASQSLGSLGAMRESADELDEAVEHAMQFRERAWRLPTGE